MFQWIHYLRLNSLRTLIILPNLDWKCMLKHFIKCKSSVFLFKISLVYWKSIKKTDFSVAIKWYRFYICSLSLKYRMSEHLFYFLSCMQTTLEIGLKNNFKTILVLQMFITWNHYVHKHFVIWFNLW